MRYLIVTPELHRIHHSVVVRETNSNYSFSLSIWDRLFGSYEGNSIENQKNMDIAKAIGGLDMSELDEKIHNNSLRIENGRINEMVFREVEGHFPTSYSALIGRAGVFYRYVSLFIVS